VWWWSGVWQWPWWEGRVGECGCVTACSTSWGGVGFPWGSDWMVASSGWCGWWRSVQCRGGDVPGSSRRFIGLAGLPAFATARSHESRMRSQFFGSPLGSPCREYRVHLVQHAFRWWYRLSPRVPNVPRRAQIWNHRDANQPAVTSNPRSLIGHSSSRWHRLLKTFWTGINGWADEQLPDGTEMLVGYGRPYVPATAKRRHSPGTPLSP
jgi:hypothetical protein